MMNQKCLAAAFVTAVGLLVGGCATEGTTSGGANGGAAAIQTDSLQSCLSKIPPAASAGTRQLAEEGCRRDDAIRLGIVGNATAKSGDRVAAGTHGDSIEACMGRIPKDATAGQRMLAEESCRRDQAARR
jgi:hypothetical protein